MKGCEKCESGDMRVEIMWRVLGQEGQVPAQINVAECQSCGHRWEVK